MRFLVVIASLLASLAVKVAAADASSTTIPDCSFPCLFPSLDFIGCPPTNQTCICEHHLDFSRNITPCLLRSCTMNETIDLSRYLANLCDLPNESQQVFLTRVELICVSLQVGFISLRIFSRLWIQKRLGADDWFMLAAMVPPIVGLSLLLSIIHMGFGTHIWQIQASDMRSLLLQFFICCATYSLTVGLIRIAVLIFYYNVFPSRRFRLAIKISIACIAITKAFFFFCILFPCVPLTYAWDKTIGGKCINITNLTYAGAVCTTITDILLVALPINELRKLQIDTMKKVGVCIMFVVGVLGCVTSIIRIKVIATFVGDISLDPDTTWDDVEIVYWSVIEECAIVVFACIPSLRPLIMCAVPKLAGMSSKLQSYLWSVKAKYHQSERITHDTKSAEGGAPSEHSTESCVKLSSLPPATPPEDAARYDHTRMTFLEAGMDRRTLAQERRQPFR